MRVKMKPDRCKDFEEDAVMNRQPYDLRRYWWVMNVDWWWIEKIDERVMNLVGSSLVTKKGIEGAKQSKRL